MSIEQSRKKVSEIALLGHPVLRLSAKKVENFAADQTAKLIDHMLQILSIGHGVGLAAPQIYESVRIVIIASRPSSRYPQAPEMAPVVMINPEFEVLSQHMNKDWEGCLSIPGIRALVPRYEKIKISYFDPQARELTMTAAGFIARIFQHEYDHLNGLVYLDRVTNNKEIISEVEFQKLMKAKENRN